MSHPVLRLTQDERTWNDYYDNGTKRGVVERQTGSFLTITSAKPSGTLYHFSARRSRVFKITWSGDVGALKVNIMCNTGERITMAPCHIPLLGGFSPYSTRSKSALFGGAAGTNLYPTTTNSAVGFTGVIQPASLWDLELEPNFALGGNEQLQFDYTLEDAADPFTGVDGYLIQQTVHSWEFPGFQGGAV